MFRGVSDTSCVRCIAGCSGHGNPLSPLRLQVEEGVATYAGLRLRVLPPEGMLKLVFNRRSGVAEELCEHLSVEVCLMMCLDIRERF